MGRCGGEGRIERIHRLIDQLREYGISPPGATSASESELPERSSDGTRTNTRSERSRKSWKPRHVLLQALLPVPHHVEAARFELQAHELFTRGSRREVLFL